MSGNPIYFADSTGEHWRVHDALYTGGHRRVVPIGNATANTRYFRNAFGVVRACTLKKTDSRAIDIDTLARQFAAAGFIATTAPNLSATKPR